MMIVSKHDCSFVKILNLYIVRLRRQDIQFSSFSQDRFGESVHFC